MQLFLVYDLLKNKAVFSRRTGRYSLTQTAQQSARPLKNAKNPPEDGSQSRNQGNGGRPVARRQCTSRRFLSARRVLFVCVGGSGASRWRSDLLSLMDTKHAVAPRQHRGKWNYVCSHSIMCSVERAEYSGLDSLIVNLASWGEVHRWI